MRVRLMGAPTLTRIAAFSMWLGASGFLAASAVHWVLQLLFVAAFVVGIAGLGRRSPIPGFVEQREKRLRVRFATTPRIAFRAYAKHPHLLVAIVLALVLWHPPLFAAAYAVKHGSVAGAALAFALLGVCGFGAWLALVGRAPPPTGCSVRTGCVSPTRDSSRRGPSRR